MSITPNQLSEIVDKGIRAAQFAFEQRDFHRAEMLLLQIERVGKSTYETEHLLALCLHRQGNNQDAYSILRRLVREDETNWEYWNSLGVISSAKGDRESKQEAIKFLDKAHRLNPDNVLAASNLAVEYQWFGELSKSKKLLREALGKSDDDNKTMLWFNMGNVMMDSHQLITAAGCFQNCLNKMPEFHAARWNRAASLLMAGQFREGWEEHESRWDQFPYLAEIREEYDEDTAWVGQDLKDKRILVYEEQGAGDIIQFIRFTRHLKERGAYVIFNWRNDFDRGDLSPILNRIKWLDEVVNKQVEHDYHQSLYSLPLVLGLNNESDLRVAPYIAPDTSNAPELEAHRWMPYRNKFKVGIVWAGSSKHHNDHRRSLHVTEFRRLSDIRYNDRGVQLFSLQKDKRKKQWNRRGVVDLAEGLSSMKVIDLSHMMFDYNSTANLISKMDLVVTVDTATAHLAGAMGKRVFLVLPRVPDWRWGLGVPYSYWYRNVRLFRQKEHHNWSHVFTAVAEGITGLMKSGS